MPRIAEWLGITFAVMAGIVLVKWLVLTTPLGRIPGLAPAVGTV